MAEVSPDKNSRGALRIGASLLRGAKLFRRGVASNSQVKQSNQAISRSASRIKEDQRTINQENKKQRRIETGIREETERRRKSLELGSAAAVVSPVRRLVDNVVKKPLESLWNIIAAWAALNIPFIVKQLNIFQKKVRIFVAAIRSAVVTTGRIFGSLLNIGKAFVKNMLEFDFQDKSGRLQAAQSELETNLEDMNTSFSEMRNVWNREEQDLENILSSLDSGSTLQEAISYIFAGEDIDVDMPTTQPQTPMVGGGGSIGTEESEISRSTKLLAAYEGFREEAYPDPYTGGAPWTIGFGSTRINGRPVRPGDKVTREEALEMKKADVQSHRAVAIEQVGGIEKWMKLPENVRVALNSLAYNYGSIPGRIMPAVRSGNPEKIADAISGRLGGDNEGINRWRRNDEANLIRTGKSARAAEHGMDISKVEPPAQAQSPQPMEAGGGSAVIDEANVAADRNKTVGITSKYRSASRPNHKGIDIGTSGQSGWLVGLKLSGQVNEKGYEGGYGNFVGIYVPGLNKTFFFAHLKRSFVKKGQSYNGQAIGEIGNTGRSSGEHLHFEVHQGNTAGKGWGGNDLDPMPYLKYLSIGRKRTAARGNAQNVGSTAQAQAQETNTRAASRRTNTNKGNNKTFIVTLPVLMGNK